MKSHRCEFAPSEILPTLGWPLLVVGAFVLGLHAAIRFHAVPAPRPALDTERTILLHQADAAGKSPPGLPGGRPSLLLLGDSSCLTDVSARQLSDALGQPVLNLGTFSFLDLNAHARLVEEFVRHHGAVPAAVVLLMHPEALRRLDGEPFYMEALTDYLAGRDHCQTETWWENMECWLGLEAWRGRVLARCLPVPLAGAYGKRFGFNRDLERFLDAEHGSVVDPELQPLTGSKEYRLAPGLERASARFRAAVPRGTKLLAGITPVAESLAPRSFKSQRDEMLQRWGQWLHADGLLATLPAQWPDDQFARSTHLRESAVSDYTKILARALRDQFEQRAAAKGGL
jgi:hypothetical protein